MARVDMNKVTGPPIVFIHYGPAGYLRRTLACVSRTNPGKRIIFLGDETNRKFMRGHTEFFSFEQFSNSAKAKAFERVFQVVQGERHRFSKHGGIETWLKFVFFRWFLIEEFLKKHNIDAFWIFDSDTLILEPLDLREARYADVEATTQCRDQCLNGWVGSRSLVERYTACIIDLFSEPDYLDYQRERLKKQAGLAFNEMDAFAEFRLRESVQTRPATSVIDGEAFDDALAFVQGYESVELPAGRRPKVKRLWTTKLGGVFARLESSGELVRLLTCNMSWMPDYLFKRLEDLAGGGVMVKKDDRILEISLREPLHARAKSWFWHIWRKRPGSNLKCG